MAISVASSVLRVLSDVIPFRGDNEVFEVSRVDCGFESLLCVRI